MKNYLKLVWKSIVLWLFNFAYTQLFNLIDTNQDGALSDAELKAFVKKLQEMIKGLKK
jgi:hypothetical protein